MARYIDVESFIEDLLKEMDAILNDDGKVIWSDHVCVGQDAQDIIDLVNNQPTANVVEVVRCKDCVSHTHCFVEDHYNFVGLENPFCCVGKKVE